MGPADPILGRFPSKFLLTVVPGVIASAVAVFVLYAVHAARAPESIDSLSDATPQSDGLSTEQRRELTRQMLKERRENPQEPALVRPTPTLRTATTGVAQDEPVADTKARPDRTPGVAPLPAARPTVVRVPPAPAPAAAGPVTTAAIAPPPVVTAAPVPLAPPAAGAASPTALPPVTVNTNPPPEAAPEPPPRSFAANVLSSISVFAGTAANATGNTVNWVIELPGKAISAGGKLLGSDSASSTPPPAAAPAPAVAPAPAAAPPPPKRNYL
jgi:hypothetical protein